MDTSLNQGDGKTLTRNEFFEYVRKPTIGETYCFLNQLIKDKTIYKLVDVNDVVSLDEELPLFEDSIRLSIIDSLQLKSKVIDILLSQNNYRIKRILNCDWFFQNSLSAESYCRDIIPHISLSLRYKLLTKLSKNLTNESDAEKICDFVRLSYRNQQAELLMPKCSPQYILNYYSSCKSLPAASRNFLKICKNHPEIGISILSIVLENSDNCNPSIEKYQKAITFLAGNHTNLFVPFLEKYNSKLTYLEFGTRLSKRLVLKLKEVMLSSGNLDMAHTFRKKKMLKAFSFDDKVRYMVAKIRYENRGKLNLSTWGSSTLTITSLLEKTRQCDRLSLVKEAFKQSFNLNYDDHPEVWKVDIMALFPTDQRINYAEKYEKWMDESEDETHEVPYESLILLFHFEKAFEKFKKLLAKTPDIYDRQDISLTMIRNCSLNKNPTNFETLLDYIANRLRNDDPSLLSNFLQEFLKAVPLSTMTINTVEKIEELAYYCTFKGQSSYFHDIIEKCILYRLEKELPVEKQIQWIFDLVIVKMSYPMVFLRNHHSKYSRVLFYKYYEIIMKLLVDSSKEENKKDVFFKSILETLITFNSSNKLHPIRVGDLEGFDSRLMKVIQKEIGGLGLENEVLNLFEKSWIKMWETQFRRKLFIHILKRNPCWVGDNWSKILEYLILQNWGQDVWFVIMFLKCISFLKKTTELKDTVLKEFQNRKSESYKRCKALDLYSHMSNWEEFEKAIEEYKPKTEKVDLSLDRDFLHIQSTVPKVMRNVRPSWKCLPLMMKFFKGDFLKMVMPSFYPCCFSTGADLALETLRGYLKDIDNDKRISIRKDAIRIIGEICTRSELLSFYSKCWDDINHYSIRTILMKFLSKYFLELPTQEAFDILVKFVEESDELVIQARPNANEIPEKFMNDYILALWRCADKKKGWERTEFRRQIIGYFKIKNIRFLSKEFCESVIREYLFISKAPICVSVFTSGYLITDPETFHEKMQFVLDLLRDRKSDTRAVANFCKRITETSLSSPMPLMADLFDLLIKNWPNYPPGVMYFEYIRLNYYRIYHEVLKQVGDKSGMELWTEFGKRLKTYLSSIENLKDLVFVLVKSLKEFFYDDVRNRNPLDVYTTMNELVINPTERSLSLIAILCLPETSFDNADEEEKNKLEDFIKTLRSCQDEVIEIYIEWKYGKN